MGDLIAHKLYEYNRTEFMRYEEIFNEVFNMRHSKYSKYANMKYSKHSASRNSWQDKQFST